MEPEIVSVLLVDADRERCATLAETLRRSAVTTFRVVPVGDSLETALEKLAKRRFQVVLLDLDFPGVHGLEGLVAVRDAAPEAAVVVLAEGRREDDVVAALKLGAYDYLFREDVHEGVVLRATRYAALRRRVEERERAAEVRYRHLFRQSLDAILVTDGDGRIVDANEAALRLVGTGPEALDGRGLDELIVDPVQRDHLAGAVARGESVQGLEVRVASAGGVVRVCLLSSAEHGGRGEGARHAVLHDITERKRAEDRLLHGALHDPLTGVPNRTLLLDRLRQAVARRARDPRRSFAVLFLDLDRFKRVNDAYGHAGGDEVLRQVARTMLSCVRGEDTVARIGGDEFALLLDGSAAEEAGDTARRILDALGESVRISGRALPVSASVGVRVAGGRDAPETLIRDADIAMYRAKATGRGRVQLFEPALRDEVEGLVVQEHEVRLALERDELVLHYHPIFGAARGELRGFEALVRWQHPRRGLLAPASFIPVAEETGLIVDVGARVLREACRQLVAWDAEGWAPGYVSVNVSGKQFLQPDLVERVRETLEATGVEPARVKLELTESTLMRHAERTVETLHGLRATGLDLWIDDFGTGYSSLAYLHRFPVSAVKIERGFVASLGTPGKGDDLVGSIVSLATGIGLATVAEGVETPDQLERVRALGAAEVQGFLFSRPLPAAEAARIREA